MSLAWKSGNSQDTAILQVTGPLTINNLFSFQDEVARVKSRVLIIDLTACPYVDSAGLGTLINTYVAAEKRNGKFLLCGANNRVTALLETAKVHMLLKNCANAAEAEQSVS